MSKRVIQWATGNQGVEAIRACATRADLELVGGWVSSAVKEGRDLGEIAGIDPIGVTATQDIGALLNLGADCHGRRERGRPGVRRTGRNRHDGRSPADPSDYRISPVKSPPSHQL